MNRMEGRCVLCGETVQCDEDSINFGTLLYCNHCEQYQCITSIIWHPLERYLKMYDCTCCIHHEEYEDNEFEPIKYNCRLLGQLLKYEEHETIPEWCPIWIRQRTKEKEKND